MANSDIEQMVLEPSISGQDDVRRSALFEALSPGERRCTEGELLEYVLEAEYSRSCLERYADKLNQLVSGSQKAAREAEIAARAKGDFLAMMSHEIRTPLNGIIGMTAVLLAKELGSAERDCVEIIRSSGEALQAIIDDILDFSKIEAGRLELECAEFDITKAIHDAVQIVQGAADSKSLRILIQIDPALPKTARGDSARLRQILLNLLSNAIKFTPAGQIDLKAEVAPAPEGELELRFSVKDQGIGITEEQQGRLFQPFSQAHVSTTRKFGGTGLGLAICKRLAELMGGAIGVQSQFGAGSSFWFTIKVLPSETVSVESLPSAPEISRQNAGPKNFRLLLVEDNGINRKVALLMLKNLGYHAEIAENGVEALKALKAQVYDLVLMDCLMPEMDGFEATRRIRLQSGYGAQVPIVAMTANAFVEDRQACLAAGMSDYLSKPVRQSELEKKLDLWLRAEPVLPHAAQEI